MINELTWWAYKHVNGTVHIKRFFGLQDLQEADESPFVAERTGIITGTRENAETMARQFLNRPQ